jgi:hypothetical protein
MSSLYQISGKMSSKIVRTLLIIFMILFFTTAEAPSLRRNSLNSTAQLQLYQGNQVQIVEIQPVDIKILEKLKETEWKLEQEESRLKEKEQELKKMESRLFELEQEFKIKEARLLEEVGNLKLELEKYWILQTVYTAFNDVKQRFEFFIRNKCYYCEEICAFFIISFTCILVYSHIQTHRQLQVCYSIPLSPPKKTTKNKSDKKKKSLKWADHCGYSLTRVKLFH